MVHTLQRSRSYIKDSERFKVFSIDQTLKGLKGIDVDVPRSVPQSWCANNLDDRSWSLPRIESPCVSSDLFARSSIPRAPEHQRKSAHPSRASESVAEAASSDSSASGLERSPAVHRPASARSTDSSYRARSHGGAVHAQRHQIASAGIKKPLVKKLPTKLATSTPLSTKVCFVCGVSKTPMWRRVDNETYCNACGLKRKRAAIGR